MLHKLSSGFLTRMSYIQNVTRGNKYTLLQLNGSRAKGLESNTLNHGPGPRGSQRVSVKEGSDLGVI